MKKKTPTEKYIDKAVTQAVEQSNTGTNISHCVMTNETNWDETTIECVQTVAEGLVANAEGLKLLAGIFTAKSMDAMIHIGTTTPKE